LNPAAVATAAAALDRSPSRIADPRRLALRAKVAESVSLARPLNDAEWRQLVVLLRDTFEASGREQQVEGRWEWRNGNLRVAVESMGTGALLDMRTTKASARALVGGGLTMLAISAGFAAAQFAANTNPRALLDVVIMTSAGVAMIVAGALPLPLWLSARRRQFAAIADYARRITG